MLDEFGRTDTEWGQGRKANKLTGHFFSFQISRMLGSKKTVELCTLSLADVCENHFILYKVAPFLCSKLHFYMLGMSSYGFFPLYATVLLSPVHSLQLVSS